MGAAGGRFCADRAIYSGRGAAADLVLRLRTTLARGVHRRGVPEFQSALRQDAGRMGHLRRQKQSGGAQQCLPRDRSAGSAESQDGAASYAERTVRYRDISPDGIKEKVRYVVGVMEKRMGEFGLG